MPLTSPDPTNRHDPRPALIAARRTAEANLDERLRELAAVVSEARTDGSGDDDEHDPDGSPVSLQRTLALALVEHAESKILALDAAAARLRDGTYGICDTCGCSIPAERLAASPSACLCVGCAQLSGRRRLRQ